MDQTKSEDDLTSPPNETLENPKVGVAPILVLSRCELHLYQPEINKINLSQLF